MLVRRRGAAAAAASSFILILVGLVSALLTFRLLTERWILRRSLIQRVHCPDVQSSPPSQWDLALSSPAVRMRNDRCHPSQPPSSSSSSGGIALAFSLVVHRDPGILEANLELLFAPRHSVCILVDPKASPLVQATVASLVSCYHRRYPNSSVFLVSHPEPIYWGHISLLNSDLTCLAMLLARNKEWRYYLNLAGSELATLSGKDLPDHIETRLRGGSYVESHPLEDLARIRNKFFLNKR